MDRSYLNPFAEPEELADTCLKVLGLDIACQYLRDSDYTNIRDAKDDELGVVSELGDVSVLISVAYRSENPEVRDVRCDVLTVALASSTHARIKYAVGVFGIGRGGEEGGVWTIAAECGSDTTKDLMEAPMGGLNAF